MKKLRTLLALLLVLTMAVFTFASCGLSVGDGNGDDDGVNDDGGNDGGGNDDGGNEGSGNEGTRYENTSYESSDDKATGHVDDDSYDGPDLRLITRKGNVLFKIVKTAALGTAGQNALNALVARFSQLGLQVEVISDSDASLVQDCEIIIGSGVKNRAGCDLDVKLVGEEGYLIKVVDNRVVILPGSDAMTANAIDYFILNTIGIAQSANAIDWDVTVSRDYEFKLKTVYPISRIKVGNSALSDYTITYDSSDATVKTVVGLLQDTLYANAGICLQPTPSNYAGKQVIVRLVSNAGEEDFRVFIDNAENLIIECSYRNGFSKGVEKFIDKFIDGRTGIVRLYKEQPFSFDVKAVWYEDFGAVGDGKADDTLAMLQTHEYANLNGLRVRATDGKVYRFGPNSVGRRIPIQTDTYWGTASFIIDDTVVSPFLSDAQKAPVFQVNPSAGCASYAVSPSLYANLTLTKGQKNIGIAFNTDVMLRIVDSNDRIYIRYGKNENEGQPRQEIILVDKNGNVDPSTPIMWDYTDITEMIAYPSNETPITLEGGSFTTIANVIWTDVPANSKYLAGDQVYYYGRGITVMRSNTTVLNVKHYIEGENDNSDFNGGYPYSGWYNVTLANNVTYDGCLMSGHKIYIADSDKNGNGIIESDEINSGSEMGTYDINANNSNAVTWKNCTQSNSITDETNWGIMNSNFSKNLVWDNCKLSRFDAHEGVYNATIKNCEIGFYINTIGIGTFTVENTIKWAGPELINLRQDFGSTWEGDVIIKDVTLYGYTRRQYQECDKTTIEPVGYIFNSKFADWDFGYTCYMPQNVTIDNLKSNIPNVYVFNYNNFVDKAINGTNKIVLTKTVTVTNKPSNYNMFFACEFKSNTYRLNSLLYAQSNLKGPNTSVGNGSIRVTGIE